MRLSRFTDLGLRGLMYLAHERRRASAGEISEAFGVSKDHMMKSLQALSEAGVLEATVGRSGGFALAIDPADLRVGRIVRILEPHMDMAECFTTESRCPLTPECALEGALRAGRLAFLDALDRHTVADLVAGTHSSLVALTHG